MTDDPKPPRTLEVDPSVVPGGLTNGSGMRWMRALVDTTNEALTGAYTATVAANGAAESAADAADKAAEATVKANTAALAAQDAIDAAESASSSASSTAGTLGAHVVKEATETALGHVLKAQALAAPAGLVVGAAPAAYDQAQIEALVAALNATRARLEALISSLRAADILS